MERKKGRKFLFGNLKNSLFGDDLGKQEDQKTSKSPEDMAGESKDKDPVEDRTSIEDKVSTPLPEKRRLKRKKRFLKLKIVFLKLGKVLKLKLFLKLKGFPKLKKALLKLKRKAPLLKHRKKNLLFIS